MKCVLPACLAALALSQYVPTAGVTFCGKYTTALFTNNNSTNQQLLIQTVVTRTILGCTTATGCSQTVTGLYFSKLNRPYFNGTLYPFIDFGNNPSQYTILYNKLVNFFAFALGCTVFQPPGTFTPTNLYVVHAPMSISAAVFTEFITTLLNAVVASGVTSANPIAPYTTDPTSEYSYLAALVGTMGVVPASTASCVATPTSPSCTFSICATAAAPQSCATATGFAQFVSGTDGTNNRWAAYLPAPAANSDVTLQAVGSNINWRFTVSHDVAQTSSLGGATIGNPTGFYSSTCTTSLCGLGIGGSYTHNFPTAGTYYYKCEAHTTMTGTITVPGSSGSSAASLTASVTVLAAAILAALALKQ